MGRGHVHSHSRGGKYSTKGADIFGQKSVLSVDKVGVGGCDVQVQRGIRV